MTELTVTTHTVGTGSDDGHLRRPRRPRRGHADRPVLTIVGSPMDASGIGTLASHFTDRPVATYDPRGAGRNPTDTTPVSPEEHADDLHRVILDLAAGPVDCSAAAVVRSTRSRWSPPTPRTCGGSWPTSLRPLPCCPT